jgi:hypothetical protein
MKGIGGHQRAHRGQTDTWLTPLELIWKLGEFDLDPCCPPVMPWSTAKVMYHEKVDGLACPWFGRVWMNPPYGPATGEWLQKLAAHGTGTALIFARTETEMFHEWVWGKATALLFLKGRLHFHREDGTRAKTNAGGPSVLAAYGDKDAMALRLADLTGFFVPLKRVEMNT